MSASAEEGLQGVRFFEFLTEEEREEFLESSELVTFEPEEAIIEEGGGTHDLFVLISGRVEVKKSISRGRDRLLAEIDATSERTVVGERGLLGESGASATVRTASRVEAIRELENRGETDLEAFRDKLVTDWAV